ncbi:unnamed protein product [Cuscuta epithymum]|uniref:Reverse transcriptase domain-containing protein n=1 Tax=Cuscuta epithymum TaxID=186058 RepID=A0AAV0E5M4_9ASTE|nr:unnamed protein product [Cuscuta epithymum]
MQIQLGQLAKAVSERPMGSLPSNTEPNPREQVHAITLRSGRDLEPAAMKKKVEDVEPAAVVLEEKKEEEKKEEEGGAVPKQPVPVKAYKPPLTYPQRLKGKSDTEDFNKFLNLFKQVQVNVPFMEALNQMPRYAKFMKELLSNKRKWGEPKSVVLNEECSAVVLKEMPKKLKDPGKFTIHCSIGCMISNNALADLGASINLMPYSLYEKLALGPLKPTRMCIQLADRSVKYPQGLKTYWLKWTSL